MSADLQDWVEPPLPIDKTNAEELPKMSLLQTLTDIFFSPGDVFADVRKKPLPRLLFVILICAFLFTAFNFALNQKLGAERIVREQLKSKMMEALPEEAKAKMLEDAKRPSLVRTLIPVPITFITYIIIFMIIGLVYWLAGIVFGGSGNYWHALSVVAYSSFPIILVSMLASYLILFLKAPEDISYFESQNGLLKINPGLFIDAGSALKAFFSRIDLLAIWGVVLGKIGLEKVLQVTSGSAWLISIIIWLIGTAFAVGAAVLFG